MKPTVGRIVHFVRNDGCEAAVVVRVGMAKLPVEKVGDEVARERALREAEAAGCVNLYVFPPYSGTEPRGEDVVPHCEAIGDCEHRYGCWHWPERE